MKAKLYKNSLELALSRCFDACEKKTSESLTQFLFQDDKLILSTKGSFTFYEESISFIECSENISFSVKTATILEFVKHVSSDYILLNFDSEKQSCLVSSSDKKTKIGLQVSDAVFENNVSSDYVAEFKLENPHEFISKLSFASKFCSNNFQDHPLTAIHCYADVDNFEIKATNGPSFYKSSLKIVNKNSIEVFIPKKSPAIIKNIFGENPLSKCCINNKCLYIESNDCKLTIYIEKAEKDSFPNQILEFISKPSEASVKVSTYELSKTLKFFNGVFLDSSVNFNVKNESLNLESKENSLAAKETVTVESCNGEASSAYIAKTFMDCLDSLQASWVNLDFINMKESFFICKLTHDKTTILLCPTTF